MELSNKFINLSIYIFFFLVTFLPRSHTSIKIPFLIIVFAISVIYLLKNKNIIINSELLKWAYLYILIGVVWAFIGMVNGNNIQGIKDSLRLNFVWILVYFVLTVAVSNSNKFDIVINVIMISNVVVSIYNILLFTNAIGATNLSFLYSLDAQSRVGIHAGYVQITSHNLGTLLFTTPFAMTYYSKCKHKKLVMLNIIISIFAILISGRRALLLNLIVTVMLILLLKIINNKYQIEVILKRTFYAAIIGVVSVVVLSVFNYLDLTVIFKRMLEGFSGSSENVRYIQGVELLKGFTWSPIIGTGFAKGVSTIIRDIDKPWIYELTYVLQLYNLGIVGFSTYMYVLFINVKCAVKTMNKRSAPYMEALLVGYFSFLLGTFTNPYLGSFDFMWILFIILAYYNKVTKEETKYES